MNTSQSNQLNTATIGQECLGFSVRRTARILARAFDEAFAPCDLKSTQFPILVLLQGKGPANIQQLAGNLDLDRTSLTRNLGPLERRGLVMLSAGEDRRTKIVTLTAAGAKLLKKTIPLWAEVQESLVAALGNKGAVHLRSELGKLAEAAAK